jgi:hypothetical protein
VGEFEVAIGETSLKPGWLANTVAAAVLLSAAAVGGIFFENSLIATTLIWGFLGILAVSLFDNLGIHGVKQWLVVAVTSLAVTFVSFLTDCLIGKMLHPERSFIEAGMSSLGFFVTMIAGGVMICALAGAARESLTATNDTND